MAAFIRAVLGLLVVAMAGLAAIVLLGGAPDAAYDILYFVPLVAAPLVCLARARRSSRDRVAWTLVGVGSLAWLFGDLYWTLYLSGLDEQPFPSPADGFFLAFYPPLYLALLLMLRTRIQRLRAHIWLDGLMGALAVERSRRRSCTRPSRRRARAAAGRSRRTSPTRSRTRSCSRWSSEPWR